MTDAETVAALRAAIADALEHLEQHFEVAGQSNLETEVKDAIAVLRYALANSTRT